MGKTILAIHKVKWRIKIVHR